MRLIGYVRVSSEGQVDGFGLDTQERAIRAWAKMNDHALAQIINDSGVSGALDATDRPGLSEVLATLARQEAQGLVVARIDRLARALTVQEATLAVIWRSGGQVFAADAGQVAADDPDDPMRTALRQIVGVFAELDRRMVVKRLKDGRFAKARAGGKAVGSYPYGYTGEGRGRARTVVPLSDEQEVLRLICEARVQGTSYRAIATLLDCLGYRPRRARSWSPMTVRSIALRGSPPNNDCNRSTPAD